MKIISSSAVFFATVLFANGQGTFLYDQQSATEIGVPGGFAPINSNQPIGQSFTPSLQGVGFVQLQVWEVPPSQLASATIRVDLWGESLGGTLLGSTTSVFLPADFYGITSFFFPIPVSVVPGTAYYFQPIIVAGGDDRWSIFAGNYGYSGGTLFHNGLPNTNDRDVWFREGVIVPEPSATVLLGLGFGVLFYARRVHIKRSQLP